MEIVEQRAPLGFSTLGDVISDEELEEIVITSYSIHYTKLYEFIVNYINAFTPDRGCDHRLLHCQGLEQLQSRPPTAPQGNDIESRPTNERSYVLHKTGDDDIGRRFRITSYNVCYTKLLRVLRAAIIVPYTTGHTRATTGQGRPMIFP